MTAYLTRNAHVHGIQTVEATLLDTAPNAIQVGNETYTGHDWHFSEQRAREHLRDVAMALLDVADFGAVAS